MKVMVRVMTMSVLISFLSVAGLAQERRMQIRGGAGWSTFGVESVVSHAVAGVAVDFRLAGGLRAGLETVYHNGPDSDQDVTILPLVSYDFRRSTKVVPFVSGGIGTLHHDTGHRWTNSVSFGGGAGVKLAVTNRLFVAPEFRIGWDPVARAMVSVGYRF